MKVVDRCILNSKTKSVHASTIEFWNGHPVFSWFGGSKEGAQDVALYIENLHGNGNVLSTGNNDATPRWNPILFSHEGELYLFEKAGIFCDRWQTIIHNLTETKEGATGTEIRKGCQILPAGLNGPVKTRPVIHNGEIICGSSVETFCDWASYMETYQVKGGQWVFKGRSNPIFPERKAYDYYGNQRVSLGIIQPAIWKDESGLHSVFRSSRGLDNIFYSKGEDSCSWSTPMETKLPNPNSGIDVATIGNRAFLVYNPDNRFRMPLNIAEIRVGNGEIEVVDEITVTKEIHDVVDIQTFTDELSYPYMIAYEGRLHLVYTVGRTKIEYVVVEI